MTQVSSQQRDTIQRLSPPELAHAVGERLLYAFGLGSDLILDKRNQGVQASFPLVGTPTALPLIGSDRLMTQGANEPDAAFALRLSQAFDTWGVAGSRLAILEEVQAYFSTPVPLYAAQLPECLIVGGNSATSMWDTIYTTTPTGAPPAHTPVSPVNWNWDGKYQHWRSWLILFMSLLTTGQGGSAASVTSTGGGTSLGRLVNGVWVPGVTPLGFSYATITGLVGMTSANVQQYITLSGAANSANNVTAQIVSVPTIGSCTIATTTSVVGDANNGAINWSIGRYPVIGPGPTWGAPGQLWGDTNRSWGLSCAPGVIEGVRSLLRQWKSANSYYPYIMVSFGGSDSRPGSSFSPNSVQGSGNPDGSWGSPGKNVNGVWIPARIAPNQLDSFDAFCDGTGLYQLCNVHNIT